MPHSPLPRKVRHKKAVATPSAPIKLRDLARRTRLTVAQLETALAMPIDEILSLAADPIRAESLIGWFNEPGNIPAPPAKETPAISYREASVTVDGWRPYLTKSEYIVARFILDRTHRW